MNYTKKSFTLPTAPNASQFTWDLAFLSKEDFEKKYPYLRRLIDQCPTCKKHGNFTEWCESCEINRMIRESDEEAVRLWGAPCYCACCNRPFNSHDPLSNVCSDECIEQLARGTEAGQKIKDSGNEIL
jgi:hypothetical protein